MKKYLDGKLDYKEVIENREGKYAIKEEKKALKFEKISQDARLEMELMRSEMDE